MILTFARQNMDSMDAKLNELREDYKVDIVGFSVSGRFVYVMVDINLLYELTMQGMRGTHPKKELPEDPYDLI